MKLDEKFIIFTLTLFYTCLQYASLAQWAHASGVYESTVVESYDGMSFLKEIGVDGEPFFMFKEEPGKK